MSTIRHPVKQHQWWYAAGLAVFAMLLVLMFMVLRPTSEQGSATAGGPSGINASVNQPQAKLCLALPPGSARIELAQPGCSGR